MRNYLRGRHEVIPITSDQHLIVFTSKPQNSFICRLWINQLPQLEDFVAHGRKAVSHIVWHVVVEKKPHAASPGLIWRATSKSISPR
jgi:hypothetical protein